MIATDVLRLSFARDSSGKPRHTYGEIQLVGFTHSLTNRHVADCGIGAPSASQRCGMGLCCSAAGFCGVSLLENNLVQLDT